MDFDYCPYAKVNLHLVGAGANLHTFVHLHMWKFTFSYTSILRSYVQIKIRMHILYMNKIWTKGMWTGL